ncbi:MAG: hypothetical protein KBE65_11045 [Phycisphaerae bacterium]|nr:hypothetical protein [Phycisphaerae bacterium]
MSELVTVHKAIEADASKVVAYLENRCLHPVVLDDVEKMGPYRSQAHEVRIAVPETERDMAIHILEQMQQQEEARLSPLIKKADAVVVALIAVLGVFAVVGLLDTRGIWSFGLAVLAVVLAALALVRWAWRREPDASSDNQPNHR